MEHLTYYMSGVLAALYHAVSPTPRVVIITEYDEHVKLDPRGMAPVDVKFIKQHTKPVSWKSGATLSEVAYQQGQADLIKFIEDKVIGRRTN
jgi:hypothetical protein